MVERQPVARNILGVLDVDIPNRPSSYTNGSRIALAQIWAALSPRYRRALAALAAHEDHDKAAAALGITRRTYRDHLWAGRREFYRLWHEGEKPSRLWALDRRGSQHTGTVTHGVMHSIVRRRTLRRLRAADTEDAQPPAD